MSVKTYKTKTVLSSHFNSDEFKCKCGCKVSKVDSDLINLVEKLMIQIKADKAVVSSGYRCPKHDKNVGGSGSGPHTEGKAMDVKFLDNDGKAISSKTVVLALEDMGHKYGMGYRCGGSTIYTHIDTKKRKWYGDEYYKPYKTCKSYYDYFKISKGNTYSGTFPKLQLIGSLKKGSKGDQVKYLQQYLNWANGCKINVDGIFGSGTETEVKKFQNSVGLTADGCFGKKTLEKAKLFKK